MIDLLPVQFVRSAYMLSPPRAAFPRFRLIPAGILIPASVFEGPCVKNRTETRRVQEDSYAQPLSQGLIRRLSDEYFISVG